MYRHIVLICLWVAFASAIVDYDYKIGTRVLILTSDAARSSVTVATNVLDSLELRYDVIVTVEGGLTIPNLALNLESSNTAKYGCIIFDDEVSVSTIAPLKMDEIRAYEEKYHIRQILLFGVPGPQYGVSLYDLSAQTEYLHFADMGKAASTAYKEDASFMIDFWHGGARVESENDTYPFLYLSSSADTVVDDRRVGAVVRQPVGTNRMEIVSFFRQAPWYPTSLSMILLMVDWALHSMFFSPRVLHLNTHIDGMLEWSPVWDLTQHENSAFLSRISQADFVAFASFLESLESQLPFGSTFKPELGVNGEESKVVFTEYAADPLYTSMVAELDKFTVNNNGYTRGSFVFNEFTDYTTVDAEIKNNLAFMAGFCTADICADKVMNNPFYSGIDTAYAMQAVDDNGYSAMMADATATEYAGTSDYEMLLSTVADHNYAGLYYLRRSPTGVYAYSRSAEDIEDYYANGLPASPKTVETLMAEEATTQVNFMLGFLPRPRTFDQNHLTQFTHSGKQQSLISMWLEAVVEKVGGTGLTWPVMSMASDDMYDFYLARMSRDNCDFYINFLVKDVGSVFSFVGIEGGSTSGTCVVPVSHVTPVNPTTLAVGPAVVETVFYGTAKMSYIQIDEGANNIYELAEKFSFDKPSFAILSSPNTSYVYGPGLNGSVGAGDVATLTFQAVIKDGTNRTVGGEGIYLTCTATVVGSGTVLATQFEDNDDGTYTCSYTPTGIFTVNVEVRYGGNHVVGSPGEATVIPGSPTAANSYVLTDLSLYSDHSEGAVLHLIQLRDRYDNNVSLPVVSSKIPTGVATLQDFEGYVPLALTNSYVDAGIYELGFIPDGAGNFTVDFLLEGDPISGSPIYHYVGNGAISVTSIDPVRRSSAGGIINVNVFGAFVGVTVANCILDQHDYVAVSVSDTKIVCPTYPHLPAELPFWLRLDGVLTNANQTFRYGYCPPGLFVPPGELECVECDAGAYKNDPSAANCTLCATGDYQPLPGQGTCLSCPSGAFTAAEGSTAFAQCICPAATFLKEGSPTCVSCGTGSTCEEGSTWPTINPGYYPSALFEHQYLACPYSHLCLGGSEPINSSFCAEGHGGYLCGQCVEPKERFLVTYECLTCNELISQGAVVIMVLCAVLWVWALIRSEHSGHIVATMIAWQVLGLVMFRTDPRQHVRKLYLPFQTIVGFHSFSFDCMYPDFEEALMLSVEVALALVIGVPFLFVIWCFLKGLFRKRSKTYYDPTLRSMSSTMPSTMNGPSADATSELLTVHPLEVTMSKRARGGSNAPASPRDIVVQMGAGEGKSASARVGSAWKKAVHDAGRVYSRGSVFSSPRAVIASSGLLLSSMSLALTPLLYYAGEILSCRKLQDTSAFLLSKPDVKCSDVTLDSYGLYGFVVALLYVCLLVFRTRSSKNNLIWGVNPIDKIGKWGVFVFMRSVVLVAFAMLAPRPYNGLFVFVALVFSSIIMLISKHPFSGRRGIHLKHTVVLILIMATYIPRLVAEWGDRIDSAEAADTGPIPVVPQVWKLEDGISVLGVLLSLYIGLGTIFGGWLDRVKRFGLFTILFKGTDIIKLDYLKSSVKYALVEPDDDDAVPFGQTSSGPSNDGMASEESEGYISALEDDARRANRRRRSSSVSSINSVRRMWLEQKKAILMAEREEDSGVPGNEESSEARFRALVNMTNTDQAAKRARNIAALPEVKEEHPAPADKAPAVVALENVNSATTSSSTSMALSEKQQTEDYSRTKRRRALADLASPTLKFEKQVVGEGNGASPLVRDEKYLFKVKRMRSRAKKMLRVLFPVSDFYFSSAEDDDEAGFEGEVVLIYQRENDHTYELYQKMRSLYAMMLEESAIPKSINRGRVSLYRSDLMDIVLGPVQRPSEEEELKFWNIWGRLGFSETAAEPLGPRPQERDWLMWKAQIGGHTDGQDLTEAGIAEAEAKSAGGRFRSAIARVQLNNLAKAEPTTSSSTSSPLPDPEEQGSGSKGSKKDNGFSFDAMLKSSSRNQLADNDARRASLKSLHGEAEDEGGAPPQLPGVDPTKGPVILMGSFDHNLSQGKLLSNKKSQKFSRSDKMNAKEGSSKTLSKSWGKALQAARKSGRVKVKPKANRRGWDTVRAALKAGKWKTQSDSSSRGKEASIQLSSLTATGEWRGDDVGASEKGVRILSEVRTFGDVVKEIATSLGTEYNQSKRQSRKSRRGGGGGGDFDDATGRSVQPLTLRSVGKGVGSSSDEDDEIPDHLSFQSQTESGAESPHASEGKYETHVMGQLDRLTGIRKNLDRVKFQADFTSQLDEVLQQASDLVKVLYEIINSHDIRNIVKVARHVSKDEISGKLYFHHIVDATMTDVRNGHSATAVRDILKWFKRKHETLRFPDNIEQCDVLQETSAKIIGVRLESLTMDLGTAKSSYDSDQLKGVNRSNFLAFMAESRDRLTQLKDMHIDAKRKEKDCARVFRCDPVNFDDFVEFCRVFKDMKG